MSILAESLSQQLSRIAFESPGLTIAVLAMIWAIVRVLGRRQENKALLRLSWLPLVLIVGLLVSSSVVTTARERLPLAVEALVASVEAGDLERFRELVDPDANTLVWGRTFTREQTEKLIAEATINDLKVTWSTVIAEGATGRSLILVRADGEVVNAAGVNVSEWAVRWAREGEGAEARWRATHIECTAMGAEAVFGGE